MKTFNVFDTETTGLDPLEGHKIIEVALLRFDMTGKLLDKLVVRINPKRAIDAKAQAVHKISFAMLEKCPEFKEVAKDIEAQILKGDFLVAHNLDFDARFLAVEFSAAGVVVPDIPGVDTMQSRWATFNGKSPNLGELCFALGLPYDPDKAHAAEYDTQITAACYLEGLRRGVFKNPVEK